MMGFRVNATVPRIFPTLFQGAPLLISNFSTQTLEYINEEIFVARSCCIPAFYFILFLPNPQLLQHLVGCQIPEENEKQSQSLKYQCLSLQTSINHSFWAQHKTGKSLQLNLKSSITTILFWVLLLYSLRALKYCTNVFNWDINK